VANLILCGLLSAAALLAPGAAAAPAAPLEIVLVGPPPVRAMLREAVGPLLAKHERVVWIDGEDPDALVPPRRLRIRIEVPDGGDARVTVYPRAGAPIVRAIEGAQPEPVTVESVAQIVRETAGALAAAEPTVVLAAVPVARAPRTTTFAISLSYLQRAILDQGSLVSAGAPPERGASAWLSVRSPAGRLSWSGGVVGEISQVSIESPDPSFPSIPSTSPTFRRYAAYVMFGLGWGPAPAIHFDVALGQGIERVTEANPMLSFTEQRLTARGALTVSAAIPSVFAGFEVVGGLIVDLREAQEIGQLTPEAWVTVKTNRVQPGFTLGLAWRR